jgi:hypothetical protein
MSRAPSDRMLNKVVSISRRLGGCDDEEQGYADPMSGEESVRCALRPMTPDEKVAAGVPVEERRIIAIFRDNLELSDGDKIVYTTSAGDERYIYCDQPWTDAGNRGVVFTVAGADHEVEDS